MLTARIGHWERQILSVLGILCCRFSRPVWRTCDGMAKQLVLRIRCITAPFSCEKHSSSVRGLQHRGCWRFMGDPPLHERALHKRVFGSVLSMSHASLCPIGSPLNADVMILRVWLFLRRSEGGIRWMRETLVRAASTVKERQSGADQRSSARSGDIPDSFSELPQTGDVVGGLWAVCRTLFQYCASDIGYVDESAGAGEGVHKVNETAKIGRGRLRRAL